MPIMNKSCVDAVTVYPEHGGHADGVIIPMMTCTLTMKRTRWIPVEIGLTGLCLRFVCIYFAILLG